MSYAGSRVLITGGMGFIGSNLARRLVSEGAHVTIVDSLEPQYGGNRWNIADIVDRVEVHIADVRDTSAMGEVIQGRDFLFNLAAQTSHVGSMLEPEVDFAINAQAQLAIVECCRKQNPTIKIVYASTRQLYGRPRYLPVDENHPIHPVDVNGISKLAGEQLHQLYSDVYGVRACVLRLTNVYGPAMRIKDARQTFLGIWVRKLLEGDPIPIFGDGKQLRDFVYVDDCVVALLLAGAGEQTNGRVFNVGGEEVVSLSEVARTMIGLGHGGELELLPFPQERRAIDIGDYYSDFSLFRRECGWLPSVRLVEGLRRTVDFYRDHLHRYL